jgi:hypothetical protein
MDEELLKAEHDLGFVIDDLRAALSKATAVEALIITPIVKAVVDASNTVIAFRNAREGRT